MVRESLLELFLDRRLPATVVAREIDVSLSTVTSIRSGYRPANDDHIRRLAKWTKRSQAWTKKKLIEAGCRVG